MCGVSALDMDFSQYQNNLTSTLHEKILLAEIADFTMFLKFVYKVVSIVNISQLPNTSERILNLNYY